MDGGADYNLLIATAIISILLLVAVAVIGGTTMRIILTASVGTSIALFAICRVLDKSGGDTTYGGESEGEDVEDKCG